MMSKILWVLKIIMCLPVLPLIGLPTEGGSTDEQDNDADNNGEGDDSPENETDDSDDTPVTLTQKQIDEMFNKAFAKGARKGKREANKTNPQTVSADDADNDGAQKATDIIKKATERLLTGTVKNLAADVGLTTKGAKAAIKLVDFADCVKDDDVDEDAVKDLLEDFTKDYPEFLAKQEDIDPKAWGMRQGTGQRMSGVEAAFYARNPDLK